MQHSLFLISSAINYLSPDYIHIRAKYLELIGKGDLNAYFLYLNLP